jgi:O-antigen biosynthesis protein WbqV
VDLAEDMIRLSGLRVGEDIAVEFSGMRPGEKLFEELHLSGERQMPTSHPKIIVVDHDPADIDSVATAIDELARLADAGPQFVVAELQRLIPEFRKAAYVTAMPQRAAA